MIYCHRDFRLFFCCALVMLALAGCGRQIEQYPKIEDVVVIYPEEEAAVEAEAVKDHLAILRSRSERTIPIRISGECDLLYHSEGEHEDESFAVKLWFNPPNEIYLQGDVALNAKGIVLGSNGEEFWLWIKPKKISKYWWGKWIEQSGFARLMINPKSLFEALGVAGVGSEEDWSLSSAEALVVLTRQNEQGAAVKKIYLDENNFLISRIEYFDKNEKAVAVMELADYRMVSFKFYVPTTIKIVSRLKNPTDIVNITIRLKSIKPTDFSARQRARLFTRPEPKKFKHVFQIIGDDVVEMIRR